MALPYADPTATLTPPTIQVPGAIAPPRPEDEEDEALIDPSYKLLSSLSRAAGSSMPMLDMGKSLARYIASKTAAKAADFKTLAKDREANPIVLAQKLDDASKKEWRDWLPETVKDFCGLGEDDVQQLDKVLAIQVALTNVDAFIDWQLFHACCIAFNHRRMNFDWLDKPSYLECAWGCTVLRALRPNTDFGPGIERFICAVMLEDGLVFFPWTGGEGIALDDGEHGRYVSGLADCQDLAKDMRKVWDAGVIKSADPAELPDVDEKDLHHVQLAKLMNGAAFIRANEGKT